MKTYFILSFLIFSGALLARPSDYDTIKRAKLVEWVEQLRVAANSGKAHVEEADKKVAEMQTTVAQAKAEKAKLQGEVDTVVSERDAAIIQRDKEKDRADKEHTLAVQYGRERDVFIWFFSILGGVTVAILAFPKVNKIFEVKFPWTLVWIPAVGILVAGFYWLGRLIVFKIVAFSL